MDRNLIIDHLFQAERHIREGMINIERQRQVIRDLERDGQDTRLSRSLLKQFEDLLAMHVSDRHQILKELANTHNKTWLPRHSAP